MHAYPFINNIYIFEWFFIYFSAYYIMDHYNLFLFLFYYKWLFTINKSNTVRCKAVRFSLLTPALLPQSSWCFAYRPAHLGLVQGPVRLLWRLCLVAILHVSLFFSSHQRFSRGCFYFLIRLSLRLFWFCVVASWSSTFWWIEWDSGFSSTKFGWLFSAK